MDSQNQYNIDVRIIGTDLDVFYPNGKRCRMIRHNNNEQLQSEGIDLNIFFAKPPHSYFCILHQKAHFLLG